MDRAVLGRVGPVVGVGGIEQLVLRAGGFGVIAEAMGGSLTAANRPDGGAVFTLRLPLKDAP